MNKIFNLQSIIKKNNNMENNNYSLSDEKSITATFMSKVYSWMTLALAITGFIDMYVASSEELLGFRALGL